MQQLRATWSQRQYRLIVTAILAVGAVTLAACSSGGSGSSATTAAPAAGSATTAAPAAGSATTAATAAGSATCPSASSLSAAAGSTYTGPQSQPGYSPGVTACSYSVGSNVALLVSLYPAGTSLKILTANLSNPTTPAPGLGDSAATSTVPPSVFVARTGAPSFSAIDQTGQLTTTQLLALGKAVIAQ